MAEKKHGGGAASRRKHGLRGLLLSLEPALLEKIHHAARSHGQPASKWALEILAAAAQARLDEVALARAAELGAEK